MVQAASWCSVTGLITVFIRAAVTRHIVKYPFEYDVRVTSILLWEHVVLLWVIV